MKPPFPYFGGKQRLADKIVELFPPHESYVEPYCGGLSVLLAKPKAKLETVNDLDGDIITFWRVLRDRPADLERVCALTPHSREESLRARDRDGIDELEQARRVWVALSQRRGGQLQPTGWRFNVDPMGTNLSLIKYLDGYVARFAAAAERLRNVSLENRPALEIIDTYGRHEQTLLYVDPPYLGTTRGSTNAYRHEMKHERDHRDMLDALRACAGTIVLSGYRSELYDRTLADWNRIEIDAFTGQTNGRTSGVRTEVLWSNRNLAEMAAPSLAGLDWEEVG